MDPQEGSTSLTKTPSTRALTILLVEDEKEMANEIKNELEGRGYLVRTASTFGPVPIYCLSAPPNDMTASMLLPESMSQT